MTSQLYDNTWMDPNGNKLVWNNTINSVFYYSASNESWDRTGGCSTSWYLENTLPYDSFYGEVLSSDRWSYFNYRGTVSGSVDDKLKLEIYGEDARGGVTSDGLWKLVGDFDIKVYLDETSYYNEYRGNVSSGLTVSIDDSNKFRISKCCDNVSIGHRSDYIRDKELKYYGWTNNGEIDTGVGEDYVTCLRVVRDGDIISSYVSTEEGFSKVGESVSGTIWSQDLDVEIEIETEQYNTYKSHFLGFTISGTLDSDLVFSSDYRGPTQEFPENSIIVSDDSGLSIIDDSDKSLWMRFKSGDECMFRNADSKLSASEGKVFYTSASGIFCLDFVKDKAINYKSGNTLNSISNIAARNYNTSFYACGNNSFVSNDDVIDIDSKKVGGKEIIAVATVSGVGFRIEDEDKVSTVSTGRVQKVYISDDDRIYWNEFSSSTGNGKLYYREGISGLYGGSSTFSYTDYFDTSTTPSISSEDINDIYVESSSGNRAVIAHSCGVDYISGDINTIKYGPEAVTSVVEDPGFSSYLGVDWHVYDSSWSSDLTLNNTSVGVFPCLQASVSNEWSTVGTTSLKLSCGSGLVIISGDYRGVYQQFDFTGTDKIYFDFRMVNELGIYSENYHDLEVLVGDDLLLSFSDTEETYTSLNNVLDVSGYSGVNFLIFRIKSKYSGDSVSDTYYYVDNVRLTQIEPDYSILSVEDHNILEAILLYNSLDRKIFFANSEGYGSIDLDTNELDFFNEIEDFVSLSSIISTEYVEVIDEV